MNGDSKVNDEGSAGEVKFSGANTKGTNVGSANADGAKNDVEGMDDPAALVDG